MTTYSKLNSKDFGKEQEVQKTLPNGNKVIYTPPSPTFANVSDVQATYTATGNHKPNYLSLMTDEEIDELIGNKFEEALLGMIEEGRVYPAFMLQEKEDKILQLQREVWELQSKLSSHVRQSSSEQSTTSVKPK